MEHRGLDMTLIEYYSQLKKVLRAIYELEDATGYVEHNASKLEIDTSDPSQAFELAQANKLIHRLDNCYKQAFYLLSPVAIKGEIIRNDYDQYELNGIRLDCGTILEVLLYDQQDEQDKWIVTTIECDNEGYYLTFNGQHNLEGLEARLR